MVEERGENEITLRHTINMNGILGLFVSDRKIMVMCVDVITDPFDVSQC